MAPEHSFLLFRQQGWQDDGEYPLALHFYFFIFPYAYSFSSGKSGCVQQWWCGLPREDWSEQAKMRKTAQRGTRTPLSCLAA